MYSQLSFKKWEDKVSRKEEPLEHTGVAIHYTYNDPKIFLYHLANGLKSIYSFEVKKLNDKFGTDYSEDLNTQEEEISVHYGLTLNGNQE